MARIFASASSQYLEGTPLVTAMPLTMGLRCRANQTTAYNCLMYLGVSGGSDRINIRVRGDIGGDPVEAVFIDIPNGVQGITAGSYTSGTEMTLVVTASSGNKCKLYQNATLRGTTVHGWSPGSVNRVNVACNTATGTRDAHADADCWDAFLTNVEWNAAEVAAFAAGYSPAMIRPDARVHYWPLFGQSSPELDLFKGGALTLGGSPTAGQHGRVVMPKARGLFRGTSPPPPPPPPSTSYPQLERFRPRGLNRGLAA